MSTRDAIIKKLREAFTPDSLDVKDKSHLHEGHAGHRPGGETHFRVYIVSPAFEGKSRIERHRMVNAMLAAELQGSVHALAIKAQAPEKPPAGNLANLPQEYERPMIMSQKLVILAGLPGSGKSTLAEGLSRHFSLPLFSVDPIEAAMWRGGLPGSNGNCRLHRRASTGR